MKKILLALLVTLISLAISGCSPTTSDIKVYSETSSKSNIEGYRTYAWLAAANILIDKDEAYKGRDYDVNAYFEAQIAKELLSAGKIETEMTPDFLVTYVVGVNMDTVKEKVDAEGKKFIDSVPEAALAIVLIDTKTHRIIWASTAEGEIKSEMSDEESKERVSYAVKKMFEAF